jgi:hypothetical protein
LKITIESHQHIYNGTVAPAFARVYSSQPFYNDDSQSVQNGAVGSDNYVKQVAVTYAAGIATIATFATTNRIDSTIVASTGRSKSFYTLTLHDAHGRYLTTVYENIKIPESPTTTTWTDLARSSNTVSIPYRAEYYNREQIDELLRNLRALIVANNGYSDEEAQDAIGSILNNSVDLTLSYDDDTPYITGGLNNTVISSKPSAGTLVGTESVLVEVANVLKETTMTEIATYINAEASGYTDEEAQDAVGSILTDTNDIDFVYTDGTPIIEANLKATAISSKSSVTLTGTEEILVNDAGTLKKAVIQGIVDLVSYTDEQAQDAVGTILSDAGDIDFTYADATPAISAVVKADSVTYAKMQNVSATDRLLGRVSSGGGDVEEIPITDFVQSILDDADAATVRGTVNAANQEISQNSKSADYTTVLADSNKHILHPSTDDNARTFTIAANASVAYPLGTAITFINEVNTITIAISSDTLVLAGDGSTGSRTLAANSMATAIKIGTTKWLIGGSGIS